MRTATLPAKLPAKVCTDDILERVENNTLLLYKKNQFYIEKIFFAIFSVKITKTTNIVKTPYI